MNSKMNYMKPMQMKLFLGGECTFKVDKEIILKKSFKKSKTSYQKKYLQYIAYFYQFVFEGKL